MVPLILFVCSGNTCRSPMAEALFRLALRPGAPWRAASAGLAAHAGGRACAEAVQAVAEAGGDLKGH
nr:low molecular weight protein arginine phosphatase [Kiritimatiellia bacterium]